MKQVIEVKSVNARQSKADVTYWEIETDKGKYTCHEKDISDKLMQVYLNKKFAEIEMVESSDGKWKNISFA